MDFDERIKRLEAIESAAQRLWPAIKFFGICGSAPEYVAAMIDLGRALGKIQDDSAGGGAMSNEAIQKIKAQAAKEAVAEVVNFIRNSDGCRGAVGRRAAESVADVVADLKLK